MAYLGNTAQNQNYVPAIDYFNGDGTTVAFTLSRPVAAVSQVQVVVNNVAQNPGSAFTVLNSTITFTSAPSSGTGNIYVYYTSPNTQVIQPGQGTVGNTQMASGAALANIGAGGLTPTYLAQPLTSGTAVASTSGTSIDFTSIPSWVKRITVMLAGISTSGSSSPLIQVGAGSVTTTGYTNTAVLVTVANNTTRGSSSTSGFLVYYAGSTGSYVFSGSVVFVTPGSNIWIASGVINNSNNTDVTSTAGQITLGGTLDRVRITTVNGTDTFDAGSINILYE